MSVIVAAPYPAPFATAAPFPPQAVPAAPVPVGAVVVTQGPQGPVGPASSGFGTIDYTDLDEGAPLALPAGTWVRLTRRAQPSPANYNLPRGPWTGFTFWDGSMLYGRAVGDAILMKFTFTVIPAQRGSGLSFSVRPADDVTFEFGPEPIVLEVDAGQMQTGSETFFEQVRTRFAQSGATIYALSTTGATLTQFSPEFTPLAHA